MEYESSKAGIAVLGTAVLVVFAVFLVGGFSQMISVSKPDALMTHISSGATQTGFANRDSDFAYFAGPPDARVTVVEFFDFQCPYSRQAFSTIDNLVKRYAGQPVKFVFRHVPIESIHPAAFDAALAASCAKEQNRFMEMHDALFEKQNQITKESLLKFAEEAGVPNLARFQSCMLARRYENVIRKDTSEGLALGVEGTPTFFVNEKKLEGAHDEQVFIDAIDQALKISN